MFVTFEADAGMPGDCFRVDLVEPEVGVYTVNPAVQRALDSG
jgi:hypothetical protein